MTHRRRHLPVTHLERVSSSERPKRDRIQGETTGDINRLKHDLKLYFESRWARGVERDWTAPDLWGDNPNPKRRVIGSTHGS